MAVERYGIPRVMVDHRLRVALEGGPGMQSLFAVAEGVLHETGWRGHLHPHRTGDDSGVASGG